MTPQEFGQAIKAERQRIGLTQAGLAERIGCKESLVTAWELGRRIPKVRDLWLLARVFDSHRFDAAVDALISEGRRGVVPELHGGCLGTYVAIRAQAEELITDIAVLQSVVCRDPETWGADAVRTLKMNALDMIRTATALLIELESLFGGSASADHREHIAWMQAEGYKPKSGRSGADRAA